MNLSINVLDIIFIAIVIIFIISGYYKGLFKELSGILSFFLGIVLFKTFYEPISSVLSKNSIVIKIKDALADKFIEKMNIYDYIKNTEDNFLNIIQHSNFPKIIKDLIIEKGDGIAEKIHIENIIGDIIGKIIVIFMIIVLVVIISEIVRLVVLKSIKIITKIPILKRVDRTFGAFLGAINGVIIVILICIIFFAINIFPFFEQIRPYYETSKIVSFINEGKVIKYILKIILELVK